MTQHALGFDVGLSGVRAAVVRDDGVLVASARRPHRRARMARRDRGARPRGVARGRRGGRAARRWPRPAVRRSRPWAWPRWAPPPCSWTPSFARSPRRSSSRSTAARSRSGSRWRRAGPPNAPEQTLDNALPKLAWWLEHDPDAVARAAWALDATGFVVGALTGVPVMDSITAADYAIPGVEPPVPLPEPVDATAVAGGLSAAWAERLGLPPGLPGHRRHLRLLRRPRGRRRAAPRRRRAGARQHHDHLPRRGGRLRRLRPGSALSAYPGEGSGRGRLDALGRAGARLVRRPLRRRRRRGARRRRARARRAAGAAVPGRRANAAVGPVRARRARRPLPATADRPRSTGRSWTRWRWRRSTTPSAWRRSWARARRGAPPVAAPATRCGRRPRPTRSARRSRSPPTRARRSARRCSRCGRSGVDPDRPPAAVVEPDPGRGERYRALLPAFRELSEAVAPILREVDSGGSGVPRVRASGDPRHHARRSAPRNRRRAGGVAARARARPRARCSCGSRPAASAPPTPASTPSA